MTSGKFVAVTLSAALVLGCTMEPGSESEPTDKNWFDADGHWRGDADLAPA